MSKESLDYERGLQQGKFDKEMELAPEIINLRNENLKLRNNWNKLKAIVENRYNFNKLEYLEGVEKRKAKIYKQFFDMMCELENNNE